MFGITAGIIMKNVGLVIYGACAAVVLQIYVLVKSIYSLKIVMVVVVVCFSCSKLQAWARQVS